MDTKDQEIEKWKQLKEQSIENHIAAKVNASINDHVAQFADKNLADLGWTEEKTE